MLRDAKYLLAYIIPLSIFPALYYAGWMTFLPIVIGFVGIPLLDSLVKGTATNFNETEEAVKLKNRFFDVLLYLNVPILYAMLACFFYMLTQGIYEIYELIGLTVSVGLILGTTGINVAHELGHRTTAFEKFLAKALLLPSLYLHFVIEHNRGHHKNVATDLDPASSRLNESVYAFWWRSVTGGYVSAWKLENERLRKIGAPVLSLKNEMIRFQIIQIAYLAAVGLIFSWAIVPFAIYAAIGGFLMLESVNYIEHYGLRRRQKASGRYENVQPIHSWNSDHEIGRIMLYELTRHSDHHFKATRKYQVLRRFEESPQLPHGYPASILLSLVPPLWFKIMNERAMKFQENLQPLS